MSTYTLVDNGHIFVEDNHVFEVSDVPIAPIWRFSADNTQSQAGLSDNASVVQLYDMMGVNHASQATATNRGVLKTNQINGKSIVRLDGSNDYYVTSIADIPMRTAILVMKHNAGTNNYGALFSSIQAFVDPNNRNYFDGQGGSTSFFRSDYSPLFGTAAEKNRCFNGLSPIAPASLLISSSFRVLSIDLVKELAAYFYINKLFTRTDTSFFMNIDIAEMLIFDKRLSEGDREYYVNQLKTAYAL